MKLGVHDADGFTIATGLCGPGVGKLRVLKVLITGEIRRACGVMPGRGPLVRNRPTDIEAVRRCVHWLHCEVKEHEYLRQVVGHWLSHARSATLELNCVIPSWFSRFLCLLSQMVYNPHYTGVQGRIDAHLDKFTEENSRIIR